MEEARMSTGYALAYRFGVTPWERAGKVANESFGALLDREEADRARPFGRALDLGCGRGQHTHDLARRGWEAVGVDNVARAVDAARASGGSSATFTVGDVTDLPAASLGRFDFFLDVGCFHGLGASQRQAEAAGITACAADGSTVLLLGFQPAGLPFVPRGVTRADVEAAFSGWDLLSVDPADTSGMPGPLKRTKPQWYRLRKRPTTA
jgi:SAM-dependent methyltransferase